MVLNVGFNGVKIFVSMVLGLVSWAGLYTDWSFSGFNGGFLDCWIYLVGYFWGQLWSLVLNDG